MLAVWLRRVRAASARDGCRESGQLIAAGRALAASARAKREAPVHSSAVDLHQALSNAGLSYNATMAVLRAVARRSDAQPAASSSILARVHELQQGFGTQVVSAMLAKEPSLLQRKPATLQAHYEGLMQLLPFGEDETRGLCVKCPMLLSQNPATVAARLGKLQAMLQVDRDAMWALVRRMPNILKLNVERLAGTVAFLEQAAGMDRARVVRMLQSWPMLGSVGLDTLRARHKSLAQLLGGSPADTKRVLASWPNLLVRDHNGLADKMAHVAEVLGLGVEDVRAVMLKEPGLLSYNVGTLKSKYAYITQVLRLPRERALTLLTHNRPLMAVPLDMPRRVEVLCKLLQLPEDQVYPLLHQQMSVLRFPPETMEAKVKVVAALCALNPSWQQQWVEATPMLRLRAIQSGWSTIYRLVFLLHTAQPETATVTSVLRAVRAAWHRLHPDYLQWLDRYNQAIAAQGGEVQLLPVNGGPLSHNKGPATVRCVYEPIMFNTAQGWHAGSLFQQGSHTMFPSSSNPSQPHAEVQANTGRTSSTRTNTTSLSMDQTQLTACGTAIATAAAAAAASAAVPATRMHLLAHLLRTSAGKAAELISEEPVLGRLSWVVLWARLGAIGAVLMQLGRIPSMHPGSSAAGVYVGGAGAAGGSGAGSPVAAAGQDSSSGQAHYRIASNSTPAGHGMPQLPHAFTSAAPPTLSAEQLYQQLQLQLQLSQRAQLSAPPWAKAALSAAAGDAATQPCVASALALAGHLAPFSAQLWTPPAPQHPAVTELVLLRPSLMRSTMLQQRAAWIQSLGAAHPAIATHLQSLPPDKLAAVFSVPRTRLSMLSYLVQTDQPQPWAVPVERLLTATERHFSAAVFEVAYPGYAAWKAAWPLSGGNAHVQVPYGTQLGLSSQQQQHEQQWQGQQQEGHQGQQGQQQDGLQWHQSLLHQHEHDEGDKGSDGDDASLAERG